MRNLQAEMDDVAMRRETEQDIRDDWRALRVLRTAPGPWARDARSRALASLQRAYATRHGVSLGLGERLVMAGSVWPTGKDE